MATLLLIILSSLHFSLAQEESQGFLEGIKAYEAQDFKKAESIFRPIFEQHPENPVILYNLGLAEYQLGHMGLALGLWRKARFIDSGFFEVKNAIHFTEEQLFPNTRQDPVYLTVFNALKNIPFGAWSVLCFVSLLFGGWYALDFAIKRRLPLGEWPSWIFFNIPIFLFSAFFSLSLTIDSMRMEATVVEKETFTRTNPSPDSPTLAELDEGQIVRVDERLGDWARIRTQTNSIGWVKQSSILIFKGF